MGRGPGAGVMREREGRAEAVAGTSNAQKVANTLYTACVISLLCASDAEIRWVNTVVQRLVSLDKPAFLKYADLCPLHQFFLCQLHHFFRRELLLRRPRTCCL